MISREQMKMFFVQWNKVSAKMKAKYKVATDEEARRRWMRECVGIDSLKTCGSGRTFDKLMLKTASEAEDYVQAAKHEVAITETQKWMLDSQLKQLTQITGTEYTWAYAGGIFKHLKLPPSPMDCTFEDANNIFMMLDTHRRKLMDGCGREPRVPKKFNAYVEFWRSGSGRLDCAEEFKTGKKIGVLIVR